MSHELAIIVSALLAWASTAPQATTGRDVGPRLTTTRAVQALTAAEVEAFALAERMRSAVERLAIRHPALAGDAHLSVSIGVASCQPEEDCAVADLVTRADRALYSAKSLGRNRTIAIDNTSARETSEAFSDVHQNA